MEWIFFTVLFVVLLIMEAIYFSLYYVPKGLKTGLLDFAFQKLNSGIVCFDKDGKCQHFNARAAEFFGLESGEQKDRMEDFYALRSLSEKIDFEKESVWEEERQTERGLRFFELHFHTLLDKRGSLIGSCLAIFDRTEERRRYEEEHFKATHDKLTGLYNREGFFEAVRRRLDDKGNSRWVILCLDIKDFKLINDLFGVDKGDDVLKYMADGMNRLIASDKGVCARLTGDRFAMLVPKGDFDEDVYEEFAENICKTVENEVYRMHIHIGVYNVENRKLEVPLMCDRAMLAIQRIKSNYHQIIAYYDNGLVDQQIQEKRLLGEFENALAVGQFLMFLQPQISSKQKLMGAEALVRWSHPQGGMISPGIFIPILEQAGLIHKLDYFIWETACARLKKWKERGYGDLHISVNISQRDFYYMDLYQTFTGLVERYEVDPRNLKLEITETALMSELKQQIGLLDRLRKYGFQIEIDDFGSGYSSLNTLKDIEVDVLKLDMGFLSETTHKDRSKLIMNAVIAMSKELGIAVITEGVETFEQLEYLRNAGCDMFQGYYFAKPMSVENFEDRYLEEEIPY